ncbi:MAG: sel1 repeat family protein [Planctomycetes bacterium]|nr:sel1 repeat family protein [Planctomycetota bacterium]
MNNCSTNKQAAYPARVPGVREVDFDIRGLQGLDEGVLSLPGEFGDLPHVLLRRTKGGLEHEILVTARLRFAQSQDGWIGVEFLAWWVRDLSRSGVWVQMRPIALPPIAFGTQLGRTLTFVIEFFFINPAENNDPVLAAIGEHADSLAANLEDYAEVLGHPTQLDQDDLATIQRCAEAGDASAQYQLALRYDAGAEVGQDLAAFEWFKRSADNNYPYGFLAVGNCYFSGRGVEKNQATAVEYYRQAADTGLRHGEYRLGLCYLKGTGTAQDLAKAAEWFTKAAEQEHPEAMRWLGRLYADGGGVQKNLTTAFEWYEKAAEAGDAMAMGLVGQCCAEGLGVAKNLNHAVAWYRRGAEAGDIGCQAELGDCYYQGHGVGQDLRLAPQWVQKALDQGCDPVAGVVAELKAKLNQ